MIERFRTYLLIDHRTRWRNDLSCAVVSLFLYTLCVGAGVAGEIAFNISTALLLFTVSGTTFWYCIAPELTKKKYPSRALVSEITLSRRALFLRLGKQLAGATVLALFGKFTTPSLEAGVFDARLRLAVHGEPTRDKIEKAVQIAKQAKAQNVHVSPSVITQVGQKILNSATLPHLQQTAVEAANQFASYRSSLVSLPLNVVHINTLTATPTDPKGPPISIDVGCAKATNGAEAKSGAIFGFAGFTVGNCSDLVICPTKPGVLQLDSVDSKNVTFVNGTLIYNGGNLKLDNVRFVNCTFQIPVASARNQNVHKLLAAGLTGQPINLELTA